jgi:hypothetical protein
MLVVVMILLVVVVILVVVTVALCPLAAAILSPLCLYDLFYLGCHLEEECKETGMIMCRTV